MEFLLTSYYVISSEILVLGTGPTLVRPSAELLKFLLVRGIATEVCATVRAFRFYIHGTFY